MVVNGRPLKRAKRRVTADLNDFRAFPSQSTGGDEISKGPFRSNIRLFLSKHARLPPPPSALIFSPSAMTTWRVAFRIGDQVDEDLGMEGIVEMDVVEEEVMRSRSVYCDQCRVVGWSGHPVCRKRYHFIIRNNSNPFSGYHQMCTRCGSVLHMLDSRCVSCKYEMKVEDFEDWQYRHLEDTTHLLHGVVHANGYGHLLRVNGREGGSKYLTGSDIMGFWDRLCKMLHVRKVTVMDISKKYGMEYRLLHAVTAGHPWYGGWGYEFGCGSFALTSQAYTKAVNTLSNIPLTIFFHSRSLDASFRNTISFYWSLADRKIETVRDLFRYITHLLHETHEKTQPKSKKLEKERNDPGVLCAWAKHDVEKVEESMVKVLRAVGRVRWVSWKALRGATCRAAASPELLDYCLKGLGGKVSDDSMLVAVRCNPENSAIEYRLEVASNPSPPKSNAIIPSADHLLRDLNFLYDSLLDPTTMNVYKPQSLHRSAFISATKLLDCKQFVKNYDDHENFYKTTHLNPFLLPIWCHVELVNQPKGHMAPPPELLALPLTATVAELKLQATKAFQETYLIFQNFQAEQLVGYEGVDDSTKVKLLLGEKNLRVKVRGRCLGDDYKLGQFRMERGLENWIVDCACGAKDDDGERMLACDSCGVWQHTRCSGISDLDKVPVKFVCRKCSKLGMAKGRGSNMKNGRYKGNSLSGRCKDEASPASTITDTGSYGMMTTVG